MEDTYVKQIMSQTTYSEQEARKKLQEFNNDFMRVLKNYMGIPDKKENKQIKRACIKTFKCEITFLFDNPITISYP